MGHFSAAHLRFPSLSPLTRRSSPNPTPAMMYQRCILGGSAFRSPCRGPVVLIVCDVSGRTPCSSSGILAGTWHGQSPSPSPQLQDEACQREQRVVVIRPGSPGPAAEAAAKPGSGAPFQACCFATSNTPDGPSLTEAAWKLPPAILHPFAFRQLPCKLVLYSLPSPSIFSKYLLV